MFKFLVLGLFFLQHVVKDTYGQSESGITPLNNDSKTDLTLETDGKYNFHAAHQTFYLSAFPGKYSQGFKNNLREDGREITDPDYIVTPGMGAHKLNLRRTTWNRARRYCIEEGGHLAVIRSDAEEKILRQMLIDHSIHDAWLGYHDIFEEDDWVTVLDEQISQAGWARWSTKVFINPDNFGGNQNCAQLLSVGGMDDLNCTDIRPFFCKISTL